MLRFALRFSLIPVIGYFLGMAWFMTSLPGAAGLERTDGIVVLTGGPGRLSRGFELIERGTGNRMLISGVAEVVRPEELAAEYQVPLDLIRSRVDLGRRATDTRTNGEEVAEWVRRHQMGSIRLVTNDWHMRRARKEITWRLGSGTKVLADGVHSPRSFGQLFLEYNKYLISPFGEQLGLE
ncbi:MAG TPA: YdcF family protein [Allosphingosinicella sp.]|nr:YdcF family protein [Allosphingosinicella sp.]